MPEIDAIFAIEAQALSQIIDELDYFQILKVEQTASPEELKAAYFRESRLYHPDKFYSAPDSDAKRAIGKIYKRINEAFVSLRDDRKRQKYVQDINGPNRDKKLRYTDESEEELRKQEEQQLGTTPHGKKMFKQAMLDLDAGRLPQAIQNLKMASQFEPQNAFFKQKLDEALRLAGGGK